MMQFQLLSWAPDADPTTPGVMVSCSNVIPQEDGFRATPTPTNIGIPTGIAGYVRSFAAAELSTGSVHAVFAAYGTQATSSTMVLYEIQSTGDVTARATCTASAYTEPVIFRSFDGMMYAARRNSPLRRAAYNGDFTATTGVPSPSVIEAARDFLIAFDTAEGYDWHCCAIGDAADWTPNVSNQCVRGGFYEKQGRIVAACRVGEGVLAFTESQTWLGRYVGAPEVWQWERISGHVGCLGPEAATETPFGAVWLGHNDVYWYDGASIKPLNTSFVRRKLFDDSTGYLRPRVRKHAQIAYDRRLDLVWIFTSAIEAWETSVAPISRDYGICYHHKTQKWSLGSEALMQTMAANQLGTPKYSFTSTGAAFDDMLVIDGLATATRLTRLANAAGTGSGAITTGIFGDARARTMVRGVRVRFSERGASTSTATVTVGSLELPRTPSAGIGTTVVDSYGLAPVRKSGRWHYIDAGIKNADVLAGFDIDLVVQGER